MAVIGLVIGYYGQYWLYLCACVLDTGYGRQAMQRESRLLLIVGLGFGVGSFWFGIELGG